MSRFSDLIWKEDGFLVQLRNYSNFNEKEYDEIKRVLSTELSDWNKTGYVPVEDSVALVDLVDQLAGGSRFFDESTIQKAENACIEIHSIINKLIE